MANSNVYNYISKIDATSVVKWWKYLSIFIRCRYWTIFLL